MLKSVIFIIFSSMVFANEAKCPPIVLRSNWGASAPKRTTRLKVPVDIAVIHHTVEPDTCNSAEQCNKAMRTIQKYHQNTKNWADIGYNFAIGGDGRVYEGRGWTSLGAHAPGYNSRSLGIVFIGDYSNIQPPQTMIDLAGQLLQCAVDKGHLRSGYKLVGHRQVTTTACPGDRLYNSIKKWSHFTNNVK